MKLILSDGDLEKMPPDLRQSLILHLTGAQRPKESAVQGTTPFGRSQTAALLREASFDRDGRVLHALLKRLAYSEDAEAPGRDKLAAALPSKVQGNLGRYLATLNRLGSRAAKQRNAKLWRYRRAAKSYSVHPETRRMLRDLLPALERSGQGEEPLWE
jgi:hypothetical protein